MRHTPAAGAAAQREGHAFAGIENFRDFGGAPSILGGHVRTGRLFRAGHLGAATAADLVALDRLSIATVVDLRRPSERARQPSRWSAARLIVSEAGDRAEGPHVEFLRSGDLSDAGVEAYLAGYYRQAPFEPRHLALFADAFAALDPDPSGDAGAILIHCTAGKDRTGLLAALILAALGVAPADVLADFTATNAMMTPERRRRVGASLQPIIGRAPSEAILRGFMGVTAAHLELAFAAIDAAAGSLAAYLAGLGVDAARLQRLRRRLLA